MKRLALVAAGLALVMVAIMLLSSSSSTVYATADETATAAAATAAPTPTATPMPQGSGCYTNWNSASCATGWTAVSTGVWTLVGPQAAYDSTALICAQAKSEVEPYGFQPISDTSNEATVRGHLVQNESCAICCGAAAAGSPSVVGGIAESPDLATRTGAPGMGGGTYAVLVGGLGLAGLGILAVKRRRGQQ